MGVSFAHNLKLSPSTQVLWLNQLEQKQPSQISMTSDGTSLQLQLMS